MIIVKPHYLEIPCLQIPLLDKICFNPPSHYSQHSHGHLQTCVQWLKTGVS